MSAYNAAVQPTETGLKSTPTIPFAERPRGVFDVVVALFVALLLISNISAVKLIQFGPEWTPFGIPVLPIITDGGAFLFPLTYILGDVLAEVYGMKGARRAILLGFGTSILASATFLTVGAAPAAADWPNQDAYGAILGFVPRIVLASLLGYLAGQFLNAWVLVRLKQRSSEGSLWARLLGSTVVGEAADTTIFCVVAFAGIITGGTLLNYIVVGYLYKVIIEALFLPVTYQVISAVKRREPSYAEATGRRDA